MVRFDGRVLAVALQALLLGCTGESRQPERPADAPAPAVQQQAAPANPSAPEQKAEPEKAPKDSGSGTYPWQSGPIAAL